jgi:hypothetical protein
MARRCHLAAVVGESNGRREEDRRVNHVVPDTAATDVKIRCRRGGAEGVGGAPPQSARWSFPIAAASAEAELTGLEATSSRGHLHHGAVDDTLSGEGGCRNLEPQI